MNGKIEKTGERGTATVIALLVLALLLVFVAIAVSRTTNEMLSTSNDTAETRTFTAAEASLENMTQQFDAIFDFQLSPTTTDITNIENSDPPNFPGYDFKSTVSQTDDSKQVVISGGLLDGLYATRDAWQLFTTATDKSNGVEVQLRRTFFNDRVPIFQFGIFYDDDLEFHPGPRFDFGGRVHSNGNLFLAAETGLYFSSRVSAHKEVLTDIARNGANTMDKWGVNVWVRDGSGTYKRLTSTMGSALHTGGTGTNVFAGERDVADMPTAYRNPSWDLDNGLFDGNLTALQKDLKLPLKLAGQSEIDYIELIKRGKLVGDLWNNKAGTVAAPSIVPVTSTTADNQIIAMSRYANKPGIRISLADYKQQLPGCATSTGAAVSTICGIRLDGASNGLGADPAPNTPRGYQPKAMYDGYQATPINGDRFVARDNSGVVIPGRGVWIKVELVSTDPATGFPVTSDVTEDMLSLGVTEAAPNIKSGSTDKFKILSPTNYHSFNGNEGFDTRSIIRLQRFEMDGVKITSGTSSYMSQNATTWDGNTYNFVKTNECTPVSSCNWSGSNQVDFAYPYELRMQAVVDDTSKKRWVTPFPIKMFDTREGLYNEDITTSGSGWTDVVTDNGVMSLVEIEVNNLRKFLNGNFNTKMPTGTNYYTKTGHVLRSTDVPQVNGWVLYISDRRGDRDFDGEYDMEDIYGNNDGIMQPGEDVNNDGVLQADYKTTANPNGEAPKYSDKDPADGAAVIDHSYYRRAVRLVNGTTLPGNYVANSFDTTGFTVASENAIYVLGNYNATKVNTHGSPTPADDYEPQDTPSHIPASIIGDAVMILSNSWKDARSFRYPFSLGNRAATETTVRFAMISGDAKSSFENTPHQGGGNPRMGGGVHNFKRFLEDWGGDYLNYSGSLINLYNSRNNNGAFKCCSKIYSPPNRNWVFDASFLSPERLPPGTPFFQVIQLTGFQRINN